MAAVSTTFSRFGVQGGTGINREGAKDTKEEKEAFSSLSSFALYSANAHGFASASWRFLKSPNVDKSRLNAANDAGERNTPQLLLKKDAV